MTAMEKLAAKTSGRRVRLCFRSEQGTGTLETTAAHAAHPNQSQRFFPPEGETAATMGWPVPYWYASECWQAVLLATEWEAWAAAGREDAAATASAAKALSAALAAPQGSGNTKGGDDCSCPWTTDGLGQRGRIHLHSSCETIRSREAASGNTGGAER